LVMDLVRYLYSIIPIRRGGNEVLYYFDGGSGKANESCPSMPERTARSKGSEGRGMREADVKPTGKRVFYGYRFFQSGVRFLFARKSATLWRPNLRYVLSVGAPVSLSHPISS
jgi:hypothetical protein